MNKNKAIEEYDVWEILEALLEVSKTDEHQDEMTATWVKLRGQDYFLTNRDRVTRRVEELLRNRT